MANWVKPGINVDFLGHSRLWVRVSIAVVGISVLMPIVNIFARGSAMNYGNDFKGGSEVQVEFARAVEPAQVRAALTNHGFGGAEVVRVQHEKRPYFYLVRLGEVSAYSNEQMENAKKKLSAQFSDQGLKRLDYSEGGDKVFVRFGKEVDIAALQEGLKAAGIEQQEVSPFGRPGDHTFQVTLVGLDHEIRRAFESALGKGEGGAAIVKDIPQIESVGAKVGKQLRSDGIRSVLYTLILMLFYIALRFNMVFAPGAVVALAHDVLILVGLWALLWKEFTLQSIAALLTVGGYSVNDTIVTFDRIRENTARMRDRRVEHVVNTSINETLSRTLLTAVTTTFTTMAVWYFVRGPVRDFAMALTIGIAIGTYSSIFIASPVYVWLHERFARRAKAI